MIERTDKLDKQYNSFRQERVISPELISTIRWEIQGLESNIYDLKRGIVWWEKRIKQKSYQLG